MQQKLLSELVVGETVVGFYLLKNFNIKTSSNNKKYYDFILSDISGDIDCKKWGVEEIDPILKTGILIKIKAQVTSWQDKLQLKVLEYRHVKSEDDIEYKNIIASAPINPEEVYDEIIEIVDSFENEDYKKITKYILNEYKEDFLYAPAAMFNHHSIRSGLIYHEYRMIKLGLKIIEVYKNINKDILISGIILHDMEKINEMNYNELGIVDKYTVKGQLIGHITLGVTKINEIGHKLDIDEDVILILSHMVLSHHYEPEYGSPKKPMILEAEILHYIDMIDARFYDFENVLNTLKEGEMSNPIYSLDKRRVYKPKK